jgi:hypothetical protein
MLLEVRLFWIASVMGRFSKPSPAIHPGPVAILKRQTLGFDNEAANIATQSVN